MRRERWGEVAYPAVAAAIGYAIFLFLPQVLNDGDTWLHIAAGDWMLRHHQVASADPFSFTFAGTPWVAHEWLAEVLLALAYRSGGWNGVVMLCGAAAALTFTLLAVHLARWTSGRCLLLLLTLAIACTTPSLLARPHMLALPLLEIWVAVVFIARSRGTPPPYILLPLMVLWANLHASFVVGIALAMWLGCEAVLSASAERASIARRWTVFVAGAVAAAFATPQTWRGVILPFQLTNLQQLSQISEWRSTDFGSIPPIELALIALLAVALTQGVRLTPSRAGLVIVLLYLALAHTRHQMLAGILGALAIAEALGETFRGPTPALQARRSLPAASIGAAAIVVMTAIRMTRPIIPGADATSVNNALAAVEPTIAHRRVLNDYAFGGYLIFANVPPFIDSRAEIYGDRFLSLYLQMMTPDERAVRATVERYDIGWALLRTGSLTSNAFAGWSGWRQVWSDSNATAFVYQGLRAHAKRDDPKILTFGQRADNAHIK